MHPLKENKKFLLWSCEFFDLSSNILTMEVRLSILTVASFLSPSNESSISRSFWSEPFRSCFSRSYCKKQFFVGMPYNWSFHHPGPIYFVERGRSKWLKIIWPTQTISTFAHWRERGWDQCPWPHLLLFISKLWGQVTFSTTTIRKQSIKNKFNSRPKSRQNEERKQTWCQLSNNLKTICWNEVNA